MSSKALPGKPDWNQMLEDEEKQFNAFYPKLIQALTREDYENGDTQQTAEFFEKSLRYNISNGRKRRAMFAVFVYRYYNQNPTDRQCELARVLGWTIEMLQGCFIVGDDVMDKSLTRRGQKCWSQVVRTSSHAINDFFHLKYTAFQLLDIYFKDEECYVDMLILIQKLLWLTAAGQNLDLTYGCPKEVDFINFTLETHNRIVKYKTAYYTFYLPASLAMTLAGIKDPAIFEEAKVLMLKMGEFFQIQDDYLDCFGDTKLIGKIGTDIQDNKCCWPIVSALEIASDHQKQILKDNYGRWDEECVQRVKAVYDDLDIEGRYRNFEQDTHTELTGLMKEMDTRKFPVPIFKMFLDKLFHRNT